MPRMEEQRRDKSYYRTRSRKDKVPRNGFRRRGWKNKDGIRVTRIQTRKDKDSRNGIRWRGWKSKDGIRVTRTHSRKDKDSR